MWLEDINNPTTMPKQAGNLGDEIMWKWLTKLTNTLTPKPGDDVVIKGSLGGSGPAPVDPASTTAAPAPANTASTGPASTTPIETGLEGYYEREKPKPEDTLQNPLKTIYKKLEDVVEKSKDGPKIVNNGDGDVFVPGKPKPPKAEPKKEEPKVEAPAPVPVPEPAPEPAPAPAPEPAPEPAPAPTPEPVVEAPVVEAPAETPKARKAPKKAAKKGKLKARRAK